MHECYEILEDYHKDIDKYSKIEMMECKLCRDDISNCVIEPCKHVVCCDNCVKKIEDGKCPVCRVEYTRYYKIYFQAYTNKTAAPRHNMIDINQILLKFPKKFRKSRLRVPPKNK